MTSGSRLECMIGSISYTVLRIPARCLRGGFYFGRGAGFGDRAKMITAWNSGAIAVGKNVPSLNGAGRATCGKLQAWNGTPTAIVGLRWAGNGLCLAR